MKSFLSEYGPPKKGWLRGKVDPSIPTDNNSQEKFFHTFKRTLMQTTHGDILYLKEAMIFISSQSKLESRSLPSQPLDVDCDPPKHVLSYIRGFFKRAFEMLASSESDGIFPADTFPLADLPGLTSEESLAQFLAEKVSTSMCTQFLIYLQNLLVGSLDYFIIHSIGYTYGRLYHSKRKYCYL